MRSIEKLTATDLGRYPGLWLHRIRDQRQPIIVTHHGQEVAALVPMGLYRELLAVDTPIQLEIPMPELEAQGAA